MAELTVDTTYATALYEAAVDGDKVDEIREEVAAIADIFKKEPDFHKFFLSPMIAEDDKKEVLKNVFEGKISREMLNFLYILVDKGRVRQFDRIARRYDEMVDEAEGFAVGQVYSVKPLTEDQLTRLEETVGRLLGDRVRLTNEIDKSLIAGVKVLVNGKLFDASYKARFEDLKSAMDREV